jgi:hypothetical protein
MLYHIKENDNTDIDDAYSYREPQSVMEDVFDLEDSLSTNIIKQNIKY